MTVRKTFLLAAFAAGAAPGVALAQAKCEIEEGKPNQVKDARNELVKAGLVGKPDEKRKLLAKAVGLLNTSQANQNPVGRNWVLGRALVTYLALPEQPAVTAKAAVGYPGAAPTDQIDLVLAADSAFDVVEQAMPQCESETEQYRRVPYVPLVNEAVNLYNNKQTDSAVVIARRALVIYPKSPVAYNVIGNALQGKEDITGAVGAFKQMVEAIGTDTAYKEEKKQVMLNIGQLLATQAEMADSAKKPELAKQAAEAFEAYLKEYPGDAGAQSGLARAQLMAGDSASANQIYATMLSNPDQYSDMQLMEAGVNAARADRAKEAAQLFEAGLKKNPYYRDGLFNLAVTYLQTDQLDKMPPVMERLISVDPNNPENYRVFVNYYQEKAKTEKVAANKKAVNDSVLKYYKLFSEPAAKVTFNLFSHDGPNHTLAGNIENLSAAAKTYTLKVDFLDNTGATVATQEATVAAVEPKASKPFRITVEKEGVVAFKYAPVDK
ncbi:MAG TPA: tetratricopeptide repeat protein [Gemmatimonadaceae bacterium]|jgi:tetratricopeptide (TPR) repeat protein|nr:tetratricopeptide repeat protein [Gemmatimonadaceae bacterium]